MEEDEEAGGEDVERAGDVDGNAVDEVDDAVVADGRGGGQVVGGAAFADGGEEGGC